MRILYHHRTLADGAEGIHIAEMVAAFRSLGHDVQMTGTEPSPDQKHPGGIIHACRRALPETIVQAAALAYNAPEFLETSRHIRRFRPSLLYKRHGRYDVGALAAAHRYGVPAVLEVNAVYSAQPYRDFEPLLLQPVAERLERRAFGLATVITAVSTPLARQVERLTHGPVRVLPNGADPDRFNPARANPARVRTAHGLGARLVIGWSGILRQWHGLDLLLDALATLPHAVLLIVGNGPERAAIEQRAAAAGLRDRIVITGRVPHREMPDHIAAMDVAVVADERTGIASPMKLLEYMAMGRAVVAPRLDNIRDLVDDGVNGVLFAPGDARALADALQPLTADLERRRALGARARAKVEAERNWRAIAEQVIAAVGARTASQQKSA